MTERRLTYEESLAEALCRRGVNERVAHSCSVAAIAAVGLAWRQWAEADPTPLVDTLSNTFAGLESGSNPVPGGAHAARG